MTECNLDQIHIADLRFGCVIGVNPEEQHDPQDVVAHVTLYLDLSAACRSDEMADTVDYKALKLDILKLGHGRRYNLIECLAQEIADVSLAREKVRKVTVRLEKPGALNYARTVWVCITRSKTEGR